MMLWIRFDGYIHACSSSLEFTVLRRMVSGRQPIAIASHCSLRSMMAQFAQNHGLVASAPVTQRRPESAASLSLNRPCQVLSSRRLRATSSPSLLPPITMAMAAWTMPATIDWCEENYRFTSLIAEVANTFSNIFGVALAVYGCHFALRENLPLRYFACFTVRPLRARSDSPRERSLNAARRFAAFRSRRSRLHGVPRKPQVRDAATRRGTHDPLRIAIGVHSVLDADGWRHASIQHPHRADPRLRPHVRHSLVSILQCSHSVSYRAQHCVP